RIRTLLSYGCGMTALWLSAVTIFTSIAVVASDISGKQVFLVAAKPLARWQYVLGRWLGIVMLDAMLLVCAAVTLYAFAQYLRGQPALNPSDRRAVETEVFASRRRVSPDPPDVRQRVEQRIARLKEEGRYADALEAYRLRAKGDASLAEQLLTEQIQGDETTAVQSVGVGEGFLWRFKDIHVVGEEIAGRGKVTAVNLQAGALRIQADPRLLGGMVYSGPIRVEGIDGQVIRLEGDFFEVQFRPEDAQRSTLTVLKPGSEVALEVDPTIQVSFKANAAYVSAERMLPALWQVLNPSTGFFYQEFRRDLYNTVHTLTLSARTVDTQGRTEIRYINLPFTSTGQGASVTILNSDVGVLYRVGGFEGNFIRAMALIFLQLMFLAAGGVCVGTFLSFPVACLVVFAVLLLSVGKEFLATATAINPLIATPVSQYIGHDAMKVIQVLLPDLSHTNPSGFLVDGMLVEWSYLGREAASTIGLRGVLVLALACLIFSKRELARVQV
ncbi:MAG: hypothetical protein ABSH10_04665, partial [Phycisphaerae bacterium]